MTAPPAEGARGGSFYDDPAAFERYQDHRRGGARSPNDVMEGPAVQRMLGDVTGLRVLDLGCGDGRCGRELLDAGAAGHFGIDGSAAMVARAGEVLAGTPGQVRRADLEDLDVPEGSADLVLSRLALHYIDDLPAVLRTCHRALTADGRLVLGVVHPVITSHDAPSDGARTSWVVDGYFDPGPRRRSWMGSTVTWYHRTVEDHVRALSDAGFVLTDLSEATPQDSLLADHPEQLARRRRVPLFLVLGARRA